MAWYNTLGEYAGTIGYALGGLPGLAIGKKLEDKFASDKAKKAESQLAKETAAGMAETTKEEAELRKQYKSSVQEAGVRSEENFQQLKQLADQYGLTLDQAVAAQKQAGEAALGESRLGAAMGRRGLATSAQGGAGAAMAQTQGMQLGTQLGSQRAAAAQQLANTMLSGAQTKFGLGAATGQAGVEASAQKAEAAAKSREAGTEAKDSQTERAQLLDSWNKAKPGFQGGLGGLLPDDEEGAANFLRGLASQAQYPENRTYFNKLADQAAINI